MIVTINQDLCKACGQCGEVCPRHIPEVIKFDGRKQTILSSERIELCMECGHCTAICPEGAISLDGLRAEDYPMVEKLEMTDGQLMRLFQQRRSIREYKKRVPPREILEQIVQAAASAPTGTGRGSTGVIVIDNPARLAELSELIYQLYEKLESGLHNPIARQFIKRSAGKKQYQTLQDFLMPGMHWYIRWYREGTSNEVLRDCPALMLFHSPIAEPVAAENCLIAAFQSILMAEVLGIGTCFNDIIPPACNRVPEIRELLSLPAEREIYASVTLGYPKYSYKRIPPRGFESVRYLE